MTNIIYLFGAGASAGALPIINQIPERLTNFITKIKTDQYLLSTTENLPQLNVTLYKAQETFIADLQWLLEGSLSHASVDTFAKKLYLTQDDWNLKKLKLALSIFFIHEQLTNKPDSRYDTFFASILKSYSNNFPKNVQVISWNYDYQFEMAYSAFSKKLDLSENQVRLNVKEKFQRNDYDVSTFAIYKLNGTTKLLNKNHPYSKFRFLTNFDINFDKSFFKDLVINYYMAKQTKDTLCSLSFSWEDEQNNLSILNGLTENLSKTEVLVVIGYSFPFFNRDIDKKIVTAMPNLKKVYLQSKEPENIKERFEAVCDRVNEIQLILKRDVGQFFLPNEL